MFAQRLPGLSRVPQQERRQSFRAEPPPALVKEMAIWFMGEAQERTLTLEELGFPHVLSLNAANGVHIINVSSLGLRIGIPRNLLPPTKLLKCGYCYTYLKLRSPIPGKYNMYCLMVGMTLVGAREVDGVVHLRGKITTRGMAAHSSKSFLLFNVDRFGVKELSVWCKEITRMGHGILPPISVGLDIEYVLAEVAMLKNQNMQGAMPVSPECVTTIG